MFRQFRLPAFKGYSLKGKVFIKDKGKNEKPIQRKKGEDKNIKLAVKEHRKRGGAKDIDECLDL